MLRSPNNKYVTGGKDNVTFIRKRNNAPEWNEEKHDRDEVFALLCYRGIHYAKTGCT